MISGSTILFFLYLLSRTKALPTGSAIVPAAAALPSTTAPSAKPGTAAHASQSQAKATQAHQAAQMTKAAKAAPPPFPQALPRDLPPFPGPAWHPYTPTPSAVVTRAWQLLKPLWATGPGSKKIEQTGGVWVAYLAQQQGSKKTVTAWRQRT